MWFLKSTSAFCWSNVRLSIERYLYLSSSVLTCAHHLVQFPYLLSLLSFLLVLETWSDFLLFCEGSESEFILLGPGSTLGNVEKGGNDEKERDHWRLKLRTSRDVVGINLLCNMRVFVLQDASVDRRRIIWHHYNPGYHIAFVYIKIVFLCPWIFCETIRSRAGPCQPWSVFQ